jgi:hypothetical protein
MSLPYLANACFCAVSRGCDIFLVRSISIAALGKTDANEKATKMLLTIILLAIIPADATTFVRPNCTIPAGGLHSFVSAPNVRGTLDILWSCLATIIACTYTVLHLNIPEQRDDRDRDLGWKGDTKWWWKSMKSRINWTLITVLAPEWYSGTAIQELTDAQRLLHDLEGLPKVQHPARGWTLAHAFFVNMGGFRVAVQDIADDWPSLMVLKGETFVTLLQEQGHILRHSDQPLGTVLPTETDILDRSKSDRFAKSITILQASYFCISCFVRLGRNFSITLLELGTLGFAACSMVSYAVLFKKPRAVNSTVILPDLKLGSCPSAAKIIRDNGPLLKSGGTSKWRSDTWIPTILLSVVLGAIHIAGWNLAFPSQVDRWLWRSCAIASAASPILWMGLSLPLLAMAKTNVSDSAVTAGVWVTAGQQAILTVVYVVARTVLMALMVRSLFFLPLEAFTTTWATSIPHLG